jgi:hypothetical protein
VASTVPTTIASTVPTTVPDTVPVVRLGCGTFCKDAAGYGGGGTDGRPDLLRINTPGSVSLNPDGSVPVSLTCQDGVTCRGVLIVNNDDDSIDVRSDLVIPAEQTLVFDLDLSPAALAAVRAQGNMDMGVIADGSLTPECTYPVMIGQICSRFYPPPSVNPTTGEAQQPAVISSDYSDNIVYTVFGSFTLNAR